MQILKKAYTKKHNKITLVEHPLETWEKTVLIIGVTHGDEPRGKDLIEHYIINYLRAQTGKNRMLFIPCLNPDGLFAQTRTNSGGVDLNRNFATKNWKKSAGKDSEFFGGSEPASEIETQFMQEILEEFQIDCILSLHAPFCVVNYDGAGEPIAQEISKIINYPIQKDIGYPTPGSFGTYCGVERNIATITLELDENASISDLSTPCNKIFDYLRSF